MQNGDNDIPNKEELQLQPTKSQRMVDFFFIVVGCLGILLYILSFIFQPANYRGLIDGRFNLSGKNYAYYYVHFESETTPRWAWKEPENFKYTTIDLELERWEPEPEHQVKAIVYFPSLVCEYDNKQTTFSRDLFIQLLDVDTQSRSDEAFLQQIDKLFECIISAGNGQLPRPRHHPYDLDDLAGSFVHFSGSVCFLVLIGILLLAAAIIGWVFYRLITRKNRSKPAIKISWITILVGLNSLFFFAGVFLNFFGGWIDELGASLCTITAFLGICLAPISILYTIVLRFGTKKKQWDILGVALSILFLVIVILFLDPRI